MLSLNTNEEESGGLLEGSTVSDSSERPWGDQLRHLRPGSWRCLISWHRSIEKNLLTFAQSLMCKWSVLGFSPSGPRRLELGVRGHRCWVFYKGNVLWLSQKQKQKNNNKTVRIVWLFTVTVCENTTFGMGFSVASFVFLFKCHISLTKKNKTKSLIPLHKIRLWQLSVSRKKNTSQWKRLLLLLLLTAATEEELREERRGRKNPAAGLQRMSMPKRNKAWLVEATKSEAPVTSTPTTRGKV